MDTERLKADTENEAIKQVLNAYYRQHVTPRLKAIPALDYGEAWFPHQAEPFRTLVTRTTRNWLRQYPDKTYQQLQQKAEQRQLTHEEHHDIENSINTANQKRVSDNDQKNLQMQDWYKQCVKWYRKNKKDYLNHPLGGAATKKKPSRSEYRFQVFPFTPADSPFQVSAVLALLSDIFQELHEQQALRQFTRSYHIQGDRDQLTLHNQLYNKTRQLEQDHSQIQDKQYELQAKEAELKRKLAQLKNLTNIAEGYRTLPDNEGLTSPAEQIEALEKLLAEKRKRLT